MCYVYLPTKSGIVSLLSLSFPYFPQLLFFVVVVVVMVCFDAAGVSGHGLSCMCMHAYVYMQGSDV